MTELPPASQRPQKKEPVPESTSVCATRQRDQEAGPDSERKGCREAPGGRRHRAAVCGTRPSPASRPACEAAVSLGIRPPCPKAEQGWGNRDKRPRRLNHTEVTLLIALKGGGKAGTEARSTQQWLRVQYNHPGLGPTVLLVRGRDSLSLRLSWTLGRDSQRPVGSSSRRGREQERPAAGSGTGRWGQRERGDPTGTGHSCEVFFPLGAASWKPGGNQGTTNGFLAPRQPRLGQASLLCAPASSRPSPCCTPLFTHLSSREQRPCSLTLVPPSTCRPGRCSLNEWTNYCYDKSMSPAPRTPGGGVLLRCRAVCMDPAVVEMRLRFR